MGTYGFYVVGTIGFTFIAYLLVTGGRRMRSKSLASGQPWLGRYESIVAVVMFVAAAFAICSICTVFFTWITN
jgi:hypothetical protein